MRDRSTGEKPVKEAPRRTIKVFGRDIGIPNSRTGRVVLGSALVTGGILGFLPVVGFWMLPLGILVLAHDIGAVRRFRRRMAVRFSRRPEKRK
jgi:hypothetical protein